DSADVVGAIQGAGAGNHALIGRPCIRPARELSWLWTSRRHLRKLTLRHFLLRVRTRSSRTAGRTIVLSPLYSAPPIRYTIRQARSSARRKSLLERKPSPSLPPDLSTLRQLSSRRSCG